MRNRLSLGVALLAMSTLLGTLACAPEGDAPEVAAEAEEAAGAADAEVMAAEVDVVETEEGVATGEMDIVATEEGAVTPEIDTIATEEGVVQQVETEIVMDDPGEVIAEETEASLEEAPVGAGMEEEEEE